MVKIHFFIQNFIFFKKFQHKFTKIGKYNKKIFEKQNKSKSSVKIQQGGAVAAPVGGQILSEVLPYLELQKDKQEEGDIIEEIDVPELRGMNLKDATKTLKEIGLELETNIEITEEMNKEEIIINEQLPKPGIKVKKGSKISVEI